MTYPRYPYLPPRPTRPEADRRVRVPLALLGSVLLFILALAVGELLLLGWLITAIVGWLGGPSLALWQGCVIASVLSLLFVRRSK